MLVLKNMPLSDHVLTEFLKGKNGEQITVNQIRQQLPVDMSESTIKRAIRRLRATGVINVDGRRGSNYGNIYNVNV